MKRGFRSEVAVGLCVLVIFVVGATFFTDVPPVPAIQSLRTWQEADAPGGYPVDRKEELPDGRIPAFDGRFVLLDGFERFRLPRVERFTQPLGGEAGAFTVVEHGDGAGAEGEDLRMLAGAAGTEGEPVLAAGNGVVGYVADRGSAGGKVVLIGHRLADGRLVHTRYGPLREIAVKPGALVARGERIGSVEAGGGSGARLRFEVVAGPLLDPEPAPGPEVGNRLDPSAVLGLGRASAPALLAPEPLAVYEGEAQIFKIGPGGVPVPTEK